MSLAVPDDVMAVLAAISEATNTPKTHLITELLVESMPVFKTVLAAVEDAKQGRKLAAYDAMAGFVAKAHSDVQQMQLDVDGFKSKHLGDSE
jgi:hypothetical protein